MIQEHIMQVTSRRDYAFQCMQPLFQLAIIQDSRFIAQMESLLICRFRELCNWKPAIFRVFLC